ncbi:hypothetical protein EBU71_11200 [bacterium]|nr:hypothetical protein [Candidatus Elulimicrobium humile]
MAIATLNKFTVPLSSDSTNPTQGMLMPKLKYRFRITFENFGVTSPSTELTKQVQTAAKPNVQFNNQVIETYNSKINYAGKPTWQAIAVVLRDDQSGNVSKLVGEQMQKQFDFFEQSSAGAAADYKFLMRIEITEGGNGAFKPNILETWECYGCYVTQANWQSLSYAEATPQTIDLTIQPDNCIQVAKGSGVGAETPTQKIRSKVVGNGGVSTGAGTPGGA